MTQHNRNTAGTYKAYMLRTCNPDMAARRGFVWPKEGPVRCEDWKPDAVCGNGLHGLLWGVGDAGLLDWREDAVWLVVGINEWVHIDDEKVKAPGGEVVYCGNREGAIQSLEDLGADPTTMVCGHATASGDYDRATASGDYGQAIAGIGGKAAAGGLGVLIVRWWDEKSGRSRMAIGYVGENGIEAGVFYRVNPENGQLVPTQD